MTNPDPTSKQESTPPGDALRDYLELVDQAVGAITDADIEADLALVLTRAGYSSAPGQPELRLTNFAHASDSAGATSAHQELLTDRPQTLAARGDLVSRQGEADGIRRDAPHRGAGLLPPVPARPQDPADPTLVNAEDNGVVQLTLGQVAALAIRAHYGQQEMYGGPYHGHLRAVAEALTPFGSQMEMAGWLHDILEMTEWTADRLREAGVPNRVVEIVERVTRAPGSDYLDSIRLIAQDPEATLVKIADNADSIYPERTPVIPDSDKLLADFEQARPILWSATSPENVTTIVGRVNPALLERWHGGRGR